MPATAYSGQVSRPRGKGRVHVFVVPSRVITTVAVLVPLYVTTSRRNAFVVVRPAPETVTCI
jgi:hypothetical protein